MYWSASKPVRIWSARKFVVQVISYTSQHAFGKAYATCSCRCNWGICSDICPYACNNVFLVIFPLQKFNYSQGTSTFCSYVSAHVSPSPVAIYKIACMIRRNICEVLTWHVPVCAASTSFQMPMHDGTAHSYALLVYAYIYGHGGHLV